MTLLRQSGQRRDRGFATLIVLVMLFLITMIAVMNGMVLQQLRSEVQHVNREQQNRLADPKSRVEQKKVGQPH